MIFLFRMAMVVMVVISVYILQPEVVRAHGEYNWIMEYESAWGQSCCDPEDVVTIPHEVAGPAGIGSRILVEFNGVPVEIVVNVVHPTEDHHGRAWITRYGCLFKMFGA